MIEKFRCECAQTQLKLAILSTTTKWAMFKAIFCLNEAKKICVAWHNKDWANIATTEDWDKIKKQRTEKRNLEINRNFSWHLVI